MSEFYTGRQALTIAVIFMLLDIAVNWLGLMWNGKEFTMDNIYHWFDLKNYKFTVNPVDFMAAAFIRDCILLGGAVGVWASPTGGSQAAGKLSNVVFAFMLIILAFSPSKLLAFYEDPNLKLAIGDWILMIWCMIASIFVQVIWTSVFMRVRDSFAGDGTEPLFGDQEAEARAREEEQKKLAEQRETMKLLFRLFGYMGREWRYYSVAFSFLFLYSLSRVFIPYYTGEVVSAVFGDQASYERLHRTVLIMSVLSFCGTLFGGLRGGTFTYSQARIDRQIRNDLFRSIVKQEIGFFDLNKTGEVCSRLTADCQTMSNTLSLYMNVLTRNVTMLFGSVIFMFTLSWKLSMITIIAIPIIFLLSKVFGVYYDKLSEDAMNATAHANDVAEEVLSAIRTVKSFACEKFEGYRFLGFLDKTLAIGTKKAFAVIGFIWSSELLQMGILTVVLWYGGHLIIQGKVESGLLVSFLLYQFQLGENLRELGEVWNGLMQAVGASRKVFEFIDREPEFNCSAGNQQPPNMKGRIEFKNVAFSYPVRPDLPIMEPGPRAIWVLDGLAQPTQFILYSFIQLSRNSEETSEQKSAMRYQDLKANLTKRYNAAVRLYETIATDHEAVLDQLRGGCPNARHQLQEYVDALQCETVHLHTAHAARAAAIADLDEGQRRQEEVQFPEVREKVYELLSKITDATVTLLSNLKATKVEEEKPPQQEGSEDRDRLVSPLAQDDSKMDDQEAEDPATRAPVTDNQHNYSNLNVSYVPEDAGPGPAPAGSHQNSSYVPEDAGPGPAPAGSHQNFNHAPEDAGPGPAPAGMQQNVAYHHMQARFDSRNPFTAPDEDFAQILMTTPQNVPTRRIAETTTQVPLPRTFPYLPPAESARRTEQTPRSQDARWTTTPRTPGRVEWADDYEDFKTPMTHIPVRTTAMRPFTLEENAPRQPMQAATRVHGTYPARNGFLPLPYIPPAANHVPTGTLVDIGPEPVSVPRNGHDGLRAVTQGMQRLTTTELPYTVPDGRYVNQHVVYGPTYVREPAEPVIEHVGTREQAYALPRRTHAEPAAHPVFRNEGRHFRPQIDPPKIRLPTFHGRRGEDWNKFSSLFKAVIHNRSDISDEEKLWYLIGCLQNEASNVISGLSYTAECYPIAMELLEERYGDRDEAKVKLVEELRRLRNGSKTDGYAYYDKLMSIVNQLRALGTNIEEEPLRVLIDDTVPQWIRTYIDQERLREPAWTTEILLKTIRRVVHLFNSRRDTDFPITTIPATNSPNSRHVRPRRQYQQTQHQQPPQQQPPQQQPPQQRPRRSDKSRNHAAPWNRDVSSSQQNSRTPVTQQTSFPKNRQSPRAPQAQNHSDTKQGDMRCYKCGQPGHLSRFCKKEGHSSRSNAHVVYEQIEDAPPTVQLTSAEHDVDLETPLPITQALVVNPTTGRRVKTLVFLDTGSQKDYVSEALVDALDLPKSEERMLTVNGFLGMKASMNAATTTLLIEDRDGLKTEVTATCIERPVNPLNIMRVAEDGKSMVSHVGIPSIVLGNNTSWTFIKGMSKTVVGGFKCLDSTLGLLLTGQRAVVEEVTIAVADAKYFDRHIEDWSSLETIGITDPMNDDEDMRAWEMLKSTIRLENGRYVVSLPFKDEAPSMPTNLGLCKKQTVALRARMLANDAMRHNADKIIEEWLQDQIIEELSAEEVDNPTGIITVYSPFHLVMKKDSTTTPYRMVHNASAHLRGAPALNKLLARGPVLLPDLVGMLLRFREAPTVAITDVKKAFLQLVIDEPCRDALRFLYVKDWEKTISDGNLRHFRFRRLNFGLISSPFLLAGVLKIHFEAQGQVGKEMLRNIYVDNIMVCGEDADKVAEKMEFARTAFKEIGMELSQYFSNDVGLQKVLGQEKVTGKFLGIPWDTATDKMVYEFAAVQVNEKSTKRSVLSDVCSWYDPLGYAYPVILHWKLLIQKMWKQDCSWDSPLPKELVEAAKLLKEWKVHFSIPREVCRGQEVKLVIFTDASLNAFAACAYFVTKNEPPRLLLARARLCPLKGKSTVPRLELLGVLIGTRLATFVKSHTSKKIVNTVLFTDSTIVLSWIANPDANVPVFNKRRLEEIRECEVDFRYVPTEKNPADIATRGLQPAELNRSRLWWNGPEFLMEREWPRFERNDLPQSTEQQEDASPAVETVVTAALPRQSDVVDIIEVQKYRTYRKALNVKFYVLLFLKKCSRGRLRWDPLEKAQLGLLKQIQKAEPPSTKQIKQLNLFQAEDGLWRSRGRIGASDLSEDAKTPIFIPKSEKAKGLVEDAHRECGHGSVAATLATLRQKYWMPKCRSFIQRTLKDCPHCLRRKPKPFALPTPPQLPPERVRESIPFAHVGVDLAGPFRVKMESSGEHVKRWFLLVTCLASRAVHLEILEGLSSTQLLRGFRRFVARRGRPLTVLSDNGTNFHGALPVMVQWKEDGGDMLYCEQLKLKWKFIPAMSPWNGGAYERLIGAVKTTLRKTVPRKMLSEDEFHTFVVEAEAIVNSRPLIYDDNESRVLRPIDLIQPGCKPGLPVTQGEQDEFGEQDVLLAWCNAKERVRRFWDQWTKEYLPSLRERYRNALRQHRPLQRQPTAGEVVLIHDEHNPPACWKLGRIVELHGSRDGEIRSATVKTANGRTITRSVALIHPLEMSPTPTAVECEEELCEEEAVEVKSAIKNNDDQPQKTSPATPRHSYNLRNRNAGIYFVITLLSLIATTTSQCLPNGVVAMKNPMNLSLHTICRHFDGSDGCTENPCQCNFGEIACQMSVQSSYRQSWTAVLTGEHRPHWYPSHENDVSTTKNFNFVRTSDGRRHLFKNLEVLIREADPEKPYTCIGQGQPYGDEKFCRRYLCSTNGTSYCVMGHVEQYFMRTSVGDVPINAYGMQRSTAFERRMEIPEPEKTCEEWQPRCNPDGTITLFIQRKTSQSLHFCVEHRCQMMAASNGTTVHPPRSVRLRNTTYQIDCQETRNPHTKSFVCPAADRCLIIRCLLCKEAWHNLDCMQGSLKLIALITFCALLTVILLEIVISRCYRSRSSKEFKRRKNASCNDDEIEMIPFRPRELTKIALPVLIVMMLKIAEGCGEAVSLTAMSSHCHTTPEQRNCSFFESTMLTARTRSTSCILLKDNHGEVMEHVEILTELRHRCIPRTMFWTLPTILSTLTVRRCPSAGSCQADTCSRTQWNTSVPEFGELNQEPGITRCEQAEGCITNGCFYCSPGCRFSKTTMLHANTTATEIITCTWAKEIFVRISGRDGILTQFVTSVGAPGTSILDGRIIVSATNFVSDMDENLPKTFGQQDHRSFIITERDGKLTELVRCHHGKSDGHLRCTLNEELMEFKTADDMVHTHPEGNEELFVHMASTELPTRFDEVLIFHSHSGILAQGDGAVALQIDVQGYTAAVDTEMNFCTISEIGVTGCANCRQGARIDYNCSTSFGHPQLAVATCPSTTFTANCGSGGHENTYATIPIAEVDEMCSLRCPGGTQTFRLKASITYLEDYDEHWRFTEADEKKEDLSFTVEPGEVVALVGPSGGGKSSCIAMLEHFYEPSNGEVLIDGINVRDYDHKFLHTKVALVGQEPILYARSVYENIGYGMDYFTEEMVQNSSKLANAHEFVMDTHEGYNTDVGEKGSQMSGGQKQRIAIARALVREPVVLLLDEATSALDTESEHLVQEAISKNLKGKTVILIAHRLSTVENADKIVVINKGRVEEIGTHQQLLAKDGMYKQLVQRQMLGQETESIPPPPPPADQRTKRVRRDSASVSQSFIGTSFGGSYI